MKVLHKTGGWNSKVNFVDENNVFLGYDLEQDCCEHADWFISDCPKENEVVRTDDNPNLEGFVFDTTYFKRVAGEDFDEGGMAIFRITNGKEEKFIHIFNSHNGYYGHGFDFSIGEKIIHEGTL